jgi:alkanesulfonate monooxygenase SsuD/methylene tetrahydromethanopterin reductase-like flavin-dependent oxidoreductase (luciferase family)
MPDYGHTIEFGTFLTPRNDPPRRVVDLARVSEGAGIDLVTFQDHPYQPRFHDTWTLLSFVGASTETIRLAANVHNLPMRHPAVLARSAASLDLLTGGRFELALGAGGFWDAVEAMGGPRRTPGESVDALIEAIEIIRGIWDTDNAARFEVAGDHYRVAGAKRGPRPDHDIGIWIGGYGPRMLGVTGAYADGWLPTLDRVDRDQLPALNRAIDDAAIAAGRAPTDVRRLVNISGEFTDSPHGFLVGPPAQWVRELTDLAIEAGFATFILASDEPDMIETFGRVVAPRVRAAVAARRQTHD